MPPSSAQYTLVGFTPELDWRTLIFLEPIPVNRKCSACGLVRKWTALLPCTHVLCEPCNERCSQDGSLECPLDGNHYEEEDVDLIDFPAEELLSREVKCWNEGSGCQYTTAASGITQHFQQECEHHSVCCPKCSSTVLCRDVCTHLRSASCNISSPLASESQVTSSHLDERACITSSDGSLEKQADEIIAYLGPMAVDISTHSEKLNEISHGLKTLKETVRQLAIITGQINDTSTKSTVEMVASRESLKEYFSRSSSTVTAFSSNIAGLQKTQEGELSGTRDNLSEIAAEKEQVSAGVNANGHKGLECVSSVLPHTELLVAQCVFSVKGVKSFQETATQKGGAVYGSERVYLRGYCISPGLWVSMDGKSVLLRGTYMLHKGHLDNLVPWPFKHLTRLSVIHPKGGEERAVECRPDAWAKPNQKPTASSNSYYTCIYDDHLELQALIKDGYIENDQLLIKWEILP